MPCVDNGADSEYQDEMQRNAQVSQAVACGLFRAAERSGLMQTLLENFDHARSGVSKTELEKWWKKHEEADRSQAIRAWSNFSEELGYAIRSTLSSRAPIWGDVEWERTPSTVYAFVLYPKNKADRGPLLLSVTSRPNQEIQVSWKVLSSNKKEGSVPIEELHILTDLFQIWSGLQKTIKPLKRGINLLVSESRDGAVFLPCWRAGERVRIEEDRFRDGTLITEGSDLVPEHFQDFCRNRLKSRKASAAETKLLDILGATSELLKTHTLKTVCVVRKGKVVLPTGEKEPD